MSGLMIGLMVGLGVAGGVVGFIGHVMGDFFIGLIHAFGGSNSHKSSSPLASTVIGAGLGVALGAGIGYVADGGTAAVRDTKAPVQSPSAAMTKACRDNAQPGDTITFGTDAQGQPTCNVVRAPHP